MFLFLCIKEFDGDCDGASELDAPFFHRYPYVLACAVPVILGTVARLVGGHTTRHSRKPVIQPRDVNNDRPKKNVP